jgi:hypothetical protein
VTLLSEGGIDPALIVLLHFPSVVAMMVEHIDDHAVIGQAVTGHIET